MNTVEFVDGPLDGKTEQWEEIPEDPDVYVNRDSDRIAVGDEPTRTGRYRFTGFIMGRFKYIWREG